LDLLPDAIGPGLEDVATTDAVVIHHIGFQQHLSKKISKAWLKNKLWYRPTFVYHPGKSTSFFTQWQSEQPPLSWRSPSPWLELSNFVQEGLEQSRGAKIKLLDFGFRTFGFLEI